MRYFKTTNATRPYSTGGLSFTFEPVGQFGGNWHGVLAVEDNSAAGILAGASFPQVSEITETEFTDLKKKPLSNSNYRELPRPASPVPVSPPVPVAPPVAAETPASPLVPEPAVARVDPIDELVDLISDTTPAPKAGQPPATS